MKLKKTLIISFVIALLYLLISCIYFFGGLIDPNSSSIIRQSVESFITFPAIIIFGVGFSNGSVYLAGFISLIILWLISFLFIVIWMAIRKAVI